MTSGSTPGSADLDLRIARVTESDVPVLLGLIRDLAAYEHLADQVLATDAHLQASLFGTGAVARAALAWVGSDAIGFAVWFENYSTFLGRPGIYLEDVFVTSAWRHRGIGRQLLAYVARIAVERAAGRMEWAVLKWNAPAIALYRAVGAVPMDDWTTYRLTGEALSRLSNESRH
jgi:GNAT superfamily N-acetyltransferase